MVGNSYTYFVNCARGLDGFIVGQKEDVPYDITDLMNGYCKAKDEHDETKLNQYISALFVRYWHVVVMLYKQSLSTRLEFDDIVSWVYEAFEKAAHYRSWLDSNKEISKSPKGAEKCINQCITSVRQFWYKHFNQDKRKINFITSSLDELLPCSGSDDTPMTVMDTIEDESVKEVITAGRDIVQNYISRGQVFEAIVLDGILYQDCFIESTTVTVNGQDEEGKDIEITKYSSDFSSIKLNKHLRNLNDAFVDYFVDNYDITTEAVYAVIQDIKSWNKTKFSKRVEAAFKSLKDNEEIKDWICM